MRPSACCPAAAGIHRSRHAHVALIGRHVGDLCAVRNLRYVVVVGQPGGKHHPGTATIVRFLLPEPPAAVALAQVPMGVVTAATPVVVQATIVQQPGVQMAGLAA